MNKTEKIKKIIKANRSSIAFLIGNGIHYQYNDCKMSWDDLIKKLWDKYGDGEQKLPKGISLTEIYDIIEMNAIEQSLKEEMDHQRNALRNLVKDNNFKQLFDSSISKSILSISQLSQKNSLNIKDINPEMLESYKKAYKSIIHSSRKICSSEIDESGSMTDKQCENYMMDVLTNPSKLQISKSALKREVGNMFPAQECYRLSACMSHIQELNAPILTTNFDTYLSQGIGCKRFILNLDTQSYKFTDFYPWNVYYSPQRLDNILDNFGIWHINGTTDYPRSIRLGLSDYMGCVERARRMIQGNNLNEYFARNQQKKWIGNNTWLHIIFNKNLFIFGLGLNENEVFLRWLLIQREKYSRLYNCNLKGWYIDKKISAGKELFLKSLGFEIIKVSKDYHELYNAFG